MFFSHSIVVPEPVISPSPSATPSPSPSSLQIVTSSPSPSPSSTPITDAERQNTIAVTLSNLTTATVSYEEHL